MQAASIVSISETDPEKQPQFCFDGYPLCTQNGFIQGKTNQKKGIMEVLEIEGQQFRRHIPPPPVHTPAKFRYTFSNQEHFPSANYPERVLISGPLEDDRILEQRLTKFRKLAAELRELGKGIRSKQEKINELTAAGDLATTFQIHEELNRQSKIAIETSLQLLRNKEGNHILRSSLESKMRAAADIAEYEQAQTYKRTNEEYSTASRELETKKAGISVQAILSFCDILESALLLCNYLTD